MHKCKHIQECTPAGTEIKSQHAKVCVFDLSLLGFFFTGLKLPNLKIVYKKVEKVQVVTFVTIFRLYPFKKKKMPYSNLKKKIQLV